MKTPRFQRRSVLRRAWRVISWIVFALMFTSVMGGVYLYFRADEKLRMYLQEQASSAYPDLSIVIGGARLLHGEGIRIRDVSLIQTAAGSDRETRSRAEVLFIDEILLRCTPSLQQIARGQITVQHVLIRGTTLRLERRRDGSLNVEELFPLPCAADPSKPLPTFAIEDATIEFVDRTAAPARMMTLTHVNLTATPTRSESGSEDAPAWNITGSFSNEFLRDANFAAVFDPCENHWSLEGTIPQVRLTPEFYASLPAEVSRHVAVITPFRADASVESFSVSGSARQAQPKFRVRAVIRNGRYENKPFERPITDINARIDASGTQVTVSPLTAKYGDATIAMSVQRHGFSSLSPMQLSIAATNLTFNEQILHSLPISAKHKKPLIDAYAKYRPLGDLSGKAFAAFNGKRWSYDAEFQCLDMSLTHQAYPYPVKHCRGRVHLTTDRLDFQLRGQAGNAAVDLTGKFTNPGPLATGICRIKTRNSMTIDDAMIDAAQPQVREFIRDLKLRGHVDVDAHFRKNVPRRGPMDRDIRIRLSDGWVNYTKFPYPISHIRGNIQLTDSEWKFIGLEGLNDRCRITCNGDRIASREIPLRLTFTTQQLPLDHDLESALPSHLRKLWNDIQPRGLIDSATIQVDHGPQFATPRVSIIASKEKRNGDGSAADDLRIRPKWFPYPINSITGRILFKDGLIRSLDHPIQARNQRVRISTHVSGEFNHDGQWTLRLPELAVSRARLPDEQLIRAIPKELATALENVQFAGDTSIRGELRFEGDRHPDSTVMDWNVVLDVDEAAFQTGLSFEHVHGQLRLKGRRSANAIRCQGDIRVDSMMHKEFHFTKVRGPFWYNGQTLFLGNRVPVRPNDRQPTSLFAEVDGGTLTCDATVELSDIPFFSIAAQIRDADVQSIARDLNSKHRQLAGQLSGELQLRGSASGWHTLEGAGNVRVDNANLYELPLVLAVLKRLRYGNSDTSAFTECDLEFRIKGRDVFFDRFDLAGETITLKGTGWSGPQITNSPALADREISLDFYSIVGRERMFAPILRPIIGEASRQFLLITVRGTLDNPVTRQEVLPGLNEAIRKAFPEASSEPTTENRRPGLLR